VAVTPGVYGACVRRRQHGPARGRGPAQARLAQLGGCATWSLITAATHDGRPESVLLAVAAGFGSGRICGAPLRQPGPPRPVRSIVPAQLVHKWRTSRYGVPEPL